MKKNKKTIIWTVVILLIVMLGILKIKSTKQKEAALPPAQQYAIVVSTMKPQEKSTMLTLPYLALTKNDKDVMLASRISGRVDWIKASGSRVTRGEVIAKLDSTSINGDLKSVKSQIEAQETALKNLEASHQRTLELLKVQGASVEQSQTEESKIAELKSGIESLRQKTNDLNNTLTYAIIKSPVDGRISQTMVNTGDMVMPGHPVAALSANNGFYLLLRVPTDLNVYGITMNGKVYDAVPLHSTFNSLAEYKVYVDNDEMTTGNRLEVDVIIYKGNGIELPFDAVLNRDGKSYVMVRNGNNAVPVQIYPVQSGQQGIVVNNPDLIGKELVVAKPDILLRLLGGTSLKVKED
ncbi:MAG: efflux RND transporter periplasmic adaptor subunit [Bacteroidales bacterium]|nr:efflux RND transporter periplasmic adaptor subunit [Bacteroidales bacterium]